ncbi:MAG: tetratricopeptide repeat protein [Gemmatimonadetes bacterium]|nr:tetratricopeptide repeat protein [Gemmatimonadota bacterium]
MNSAPHPLLERAAEQERAGDWSAAAETYHSVYRAHAAARDAAGVLDAVVRLGHCCRHAGQHELASELLDLALELGELHGSDHVASRALNGLGQLAQGRGDLDRAEAFFGAAHARAERVGDPWLLGAAVQNLGIIANIRGELQKAADLYRAGLAHLQAAGAVGGQVSVLNNLGMLHVDQGRLEIAGDYFEQALALSDKLGDIVQSGVIHVNMVELFLARGELERARQSCDEGFEIFSRVNHALRKAEALKFYGIIYREGGKLHLAEIHLRQSIEIASREEPLLEAEAQREMARVLRLQGRNRQALEALNRSHTLFTSLQARSDLADIDERVAELEVEFLSLVRFWGESIEAKDHYTLGHCARVADYACRIAERAGLTERDLVWFRMGAFLHDVGKTEVPEEILNKPGRLTDEERAIMERHTVIGDEMLAPVEFPWDIRPMVRSHHERWDGRGYPDGLAGEGIPRSARIMRIADVFDALTTARSYRAPLTPEQALDIMQDDAGSFDPELFEIFLELYPEFAPTAVEAAFAGA